MSSDATAAPQPEAAAAKQQQQKKPPQLPPPPAYIAHREALWNKFSERRREFVAAQERTPITITLITPNAAPVVNDANQSAENGTNGQTTTTIQGKAWETTPFSLALAHNKAEAAKWVVAKVNGKELWDLDRPLESDCSLELCNFEHPDGRYVFWHSSAHVLGEALELCYGSHLCYGPPVDNGFYYDMWMPPSAGDDATTSGDASGGAVIKPTDFAELDRVSRNITKQRQRFERLELSLDELREMFAYNHFKLRIINERVRTRTTTVYRCGSLIDLCLGPHVRDTSLIKAFKVTNSSASYWEGRAEAESLQRVYGISFPDVAQLKEWERFQEAAKQADHRRIGTQQQLWMFDEDAPGCPIFLPRGAVLYNRLIQLMRSEYARRDFDEVITPNMCNVRLWERSGHWQYYNEDMFKVVGGEQKEQEQPATETASAAGGTFALKPMNCPMHCKMFGHTQRSYRELPLRMADFGVLHRNEASGALTGLTRVRRFQQDDAHIFCRPGQIQQEVRTCLEFLRDIYEGTFGFTFELMLSTRPDEYMGDPEMWDEAEDQLKQALTRFGRPWQIRDKDGAFYGPKIDVMLTDALRRKHQNGTIQLDFQQPVNFNLTYMAEATKASTSEEDAGEDGGGAGKLQQKWERPVIIHRAILGSIERMLAILTESWRGKWPFWLSPMQAMVVPVANSEELDAYAQRIRRVLRNTEFQVDTNLDSTQTMNKKIRGAQLEQYNFILVVGKKELDTNTVNVRTRDNKVHGEFSLDEVVRRFTALSNTRHKNAEEAFASEELV